jgi:hypothetical protein
MSDELSTTEKIIIEYFLIDLMAEKVMFESIQASSKRGVQASPSTLVDPNHPESSQKREPSTEMT